MTGRYRYYVDESLLGVAKAYGVLRRDVTYVGHADAPGTALGDPDEVWIPAVARLGLIAILRDKKTRTRPGEHRAIVDHGLRSILIGVKRDLSNWGYNELLVRHWASIEEHVGSLGTGPWRITVLAQQLKVDRFDT